MKLPRRSAYDTANQSNDGRWTLPGITSRRASASVETGPNTPTPTPTPRAAAVVALRLQSKQHDVAAWGKACDNAHAQLEHQLNRITNLELLLKYGANAWRAQAQLDESLVKQMESTLQSLRR
jgi:hypothetical protein